MQKPITSRVKRSPLLKYSPAKETKDGNVEAIGSQTTEGDDITTTETRRKQSDIDFEKNCYNADGSRATDKEGCKWADTEGTETPSSTETVTTTKKGEDKTVDTKLYRKDTQDVKEPWEVRRSNRAAKIQGRAQRRAQNKADKVKRQLAKLAEKGTTSGRKYDNLKAKETETTQELENMKQGTLNVAEGRRSGKLAGSTIRREKDVVKTAADYEDPDQIQQAARRQEIAEASGMATSQAEGAPMPGQTSFSGAMETAQGLAKELELNYKPGQYSQGITMKPSAFKMKAKSPAAKKLQGNQGSLPQHLQDSIKAAPESPAKIDPMTMMMVANAVKGRSSNKMRSGFKMKGYGKK